MFLKEIYVNRRILFELTKQDFKAKYLGSYLGMLWAFVQPSITIIILVFVFQFGFKAAPVNDYPFAFWLMAGMIPWFFFSDCLNSATGSVLENSFLVKKVVFSIGMLPIVKILSALIIHLFFVFVLFVAAILWGYWPDLYSLQVFYYLFASSVLLLGLSWLTSSVVLFFKDMGQIVAMVLQFAFWMTPIVWSSDVLPPALYNVMRLNPLFYLLEGYRSSFITKTWFWDSWMQTLYFWGMTGFVLVVGAIVFKRLRPHFGDVL